MPLVQLFTQNIDIELGFNKVKCATAFQAKEGKAKYNRHAQTYTGCQGGANDAHMKPADQQIGKEAIGVSPPVSIISIPGMVFPTAMR